MAIYGLGAKSRQIYESLHERISSGQLSPGARLPSQRELGETFSVSQMTARRALAELESDGLVTRRPGSGWYVSDHQELRDHGLILEALSEAVDDAFLTTTLNGTIANWNSAAERLYGYSAGEMIGQSMARLVAENQLDEFSAHLAQTGAGEPNYQYTSLHVRKDGTNVAVSMQWRAITNVNGVVVGAVVISRPVAATGEWEEVKVPDWTARLQALTAALSMAVTQRDVSRVLANEGAAAVGAVGARVTVLSEDGTTLRTLVMLGPQLESSDRYYTVSLDEDTPLAKVVRTGNPIWLLSVDQWESDYPGVAEAFRYAGYRTAVILPISVHNKTLGALSFGFGDNRVLSVEDRAFILSLTHHCAEALERAGLYESLQQTEARFHAQFLGFPIPTYTWQAQGDDLILVDFNHAAAAITQQQVRALIGTSAAVLYADQPDILDDFRRCLLEHTTVRREMHHRLSTTGTEHDFVVNFVFVPPDLVMVHTEDVTHQVQAELRQKVADERFRALVEELPVAAYTGLPGSDTPMGYASPQIESILGYSQSQWTSDPGLYESILHPEDRDTVVATYHRALETNTRFRSEHRMFAADGRIVWIRDEAVVIHRGNSEPASEHGVLVDITERKQTEDVVLQNERRYRGLFESSPDGIGLLDGSGLMLMANGQLAHMLGYDSPEALTGTSFMQHLPDDERSRATDTWRRRVQRIDSSVQAALYRVLRRDGSSFPAEVRTSMVPGIDATSITATVTVHDVTERADYEAQLQHLALHDTTTGLPNRTLLEDRLQQNISVAQRARKSLAVLVLDFDQFKEINDTFGHSAGDGALQEVGRRLSHALRESDTIARLGGDEFGVILPESDLMGALQAATKLTHALEQPIDLAGGRFHLGVSIGVSLFPDHAADGERLLRFADVAMRAAKAANSGYAVYAVDRDPYSPTRLALSGELREAIETDELVLHYQPKMQLLDGKIDEMEALVRWNHPIHGLIPPDRFIPLAEHSGLIRPLTTWVVEQALVQCGKWRSMGLDLGIAFNLSARSLYGPELTRFIIECLRTSGVPPSQLTVEITESVIMVNPERAMEVLTGLTDLGVKLSIDDFGTGYSSLGYLRNLRAHEVKIDKSFVIDLDTNAENRFIVRSVIELGHNLGIEVVAEGVENQAALDILAGLRCDRVQGYYVSRPAGAADTTTWLQARESVGRLEPTSGLPAVRLVEDEEGLQTAP
jgi:diguanylate cyclase